MCGQTLLFIVIANCAVIEGRMRGKPTIGRTRIQMLHDLANDGGFVALKWAADDREGWRHRERMSKTCLQLLLSPPPPSY